MGTNSEESAAEDDLSAQDEGGHGSQKYACDRCRKRKTRCDRSIPCSQCAMVKSQCSYSPRYRPREKRQRVMISARYEEKVDNLTRKLEELHLKIDQMNNASSPSTLSFNFQQSATGTDGSPKHTCSDVTGDNRAEYEGESSFSAHALFATKFLQSVVNNDDYPKDNVQEMTSIVDTLREIIHAQKQKPDCFEEFYPHAIPQSGDLSLRHLPMPPIDVALSCLWKVKETPFLRCNWSIEFVSIAQFTDYFLKVYSPAPATNADLIIVNAGLFWLFSESAELAADQQTQDDYREYASKCRRNLETVLSNLPFHTPTTIDYVLAMSVATTYCRQFAKSSLAWNFITNASLMCQALGLHNAHALHTESPEARRQKVHLFWVVYTTERMLSLRLGRSSTFRDQDITVPRLDTLNDQEPDSLLNPILPRWIDTAALQGRTYDEIYSPGALVERAHVRESRARALAAELKNVIYREDTLEQRYNHLRRQALGDAINELIWHADRVASLSLLTLINRGIPPSLHSRAAFSNECITTAREALQEHEKCISIITTAEIHQNFIELYITCSLLESPFLPFIVLFCHVIETSSPTDLHRLSTVIQTLQSTSPSAFHRACSKQFRLFSALYHVARKYVEVKASQPSGWMMMNRVDFNPGGDVRVERGMMSGAADTSISGSGSSATQGPFLGSESSMGRMPRGAGVGMPVSKTENRLVGVGDPVQEDHMQVQMQMQPNLEVDAIGTELGDWFYENQQMLKFLDDSYCF